MTISSLKVIDDVCNLIVQSAEAGDYYTSREYMDHLRFLRKSYRNAAVNILDIVGTKSLLERDLIEVKQLTKTVNLKIDAIIQWINASAEGLEWSEAAQSYDGINLYIDTHLPWLWNFDHDIVLLFGDNLESMVEVLKSRGQKNIIVFGRELMMEDDFLISFDIANYNLERIKEKISFDHNSTASVIYCEPSFESSDLHKELVMYFEKNTFLNRTNANLQRRNIYQWYENLPFLNDAIKVNEISFDIGRRDFLIISPGPSLKNDIEVLKSKVASYITIAPLKTLVYLLENDVVPDFVIWRDPQDLVHLFPKFDERAYQIPLIVTDSCHNNFFKLPFKNKIIFPDILIFDTEICSSLYHGEKLLFRGGSVSTVACDICAFWGADSITLVGQDLATGTQEYIDKSFEGSSSQNTRVKGIEVDAIGGGQLPSRMDFSFFVEEFKGFANEFSGAIKLMNCTSMGAFLTGWEHSLLSESPVNNDDIRPEIEFNLGNSNDLFCAAFIKEKNSLIELSRLIKKLLDELSLPFELFDIDNFGYIEKELLGIFNEAMLLALVLQPEFEEFSINIGAAKTLEENLAMSSDFYIASKAKVEKMIQMLEKAEAEIAGLK